MKKREIQVHMAVTAMGDPHSLDPNERKDLELQQLAFAIRARFCGDIKRETIVEGSIKLTEGILKAMRKAGVLRGGE